MRPTSAAGLRTPRSPPTPCRDAPRARRSRRRPRSRVDGRPSSPSPREPTPHDARLPLQRSVTIARQSIHCAQGTLSGRRCMRAIVALGLAGLVIAGCGSSKTVTKTVGAPPTAPVSTPTATTTPDQQPVDNSCDALGINRAQRKEGTCIDRSGVKVTVVDKTSTLKLKTLTARFVGSRMASSLGDPGFTKTASGTYVVITIAVTNRLDTPVSFAGIGG